jgi:hypothetical protein
VPGGIFAHQLTTFPQQNLSHVEQHSLRTRFISHLIIDWLPDRALSELIETLKEMILFYSAPASQTPSLQQPAKEVRAKVGERRVRPVFQITED